MKKVGLAVCGLVCLCLFLSGVAVAQDAPKPDKNKRLEEMAAKCPECVPFVEKIKAKMAEVKALEDKMRAFKNAEQAKKEAEMQAKMEQLKKDNPQEYEKMAAKHAEMKKRMEEMKNNPKEPGEQGQPDDKKMREEILAQLKIDNPAEYEKVMARQAEMQKKHEEMKMQKDATGEKKRPEFGREKMMEKMKQENPEMFKIVSDREALLKEVKDLHQQLKACVKKADEDKKKNTK